MLGSFSIIIITTFITKGGQLPVNLRFIDLYHQQTAMKNLCTEEAPVAEVNISYASSLISFGHINYLIQPEFYNCQVIRYVDLVIQ